MHASEPSLLDTLTATPTPYRAHIQSYSPLSSPKSLNTDDSRDQLMLDPGASTIRLVTTAPTAPSPPSLRPFTPKCGPSYSPGSPSALYPPLPIDQDIDPLPPGGFPNVFSTPSKPQKVLSSPPPLPFVFGSPAHHISNTAFDSAATSVLAEMNARLGLTGTTNEVGLDLLQNRYSSGAVALPEPPGRLQTEVTSMFDRLHDRQFQKMEGLGEWYARRNAGSPGRSAPQVMNANRKRKSDVLAGPHRVPIGPSNARTRRTSRAVTPGTRHSLIAAAEAEDMDRRKMKRVRISVADGNDKIRTAADTKSRDESEDEESAKTSEEQERERAAIKKKLEISRARRRSSMGRVSVGGGRPPLIPNQSKKGVSTKFGFLASAKSIVKSVWKGVGRGAPKESSAMPVKGPSQSPVPLATKKTTPNLLTKPAPATNPNVPKPPVAKAFTAKPDPSTSSRLRATGFGLGRKTSTKTDPSSTAGTRSNTASSGTRSTATSSVSGVPVGRRGLIPSFRQPLGRMSRTNSLASAAGTLGGSSGTGRSIGSSAAASSIGMKTSGIPSSIRSSDVGNGSTSSISRTRSSTLFAPTASSLAKMQSTVRPPSFSSGSAATRQGAIGLAKVQERRPFARGGLPTFTPPPPIGGGAVTPNKIPESIFSDGGPTLSLSPTPAGEPKPRAPATRRPRISRSRVIARVGAQRAASGSSLSRTPSGRRSFNGPKTRGSLGMRVSGIGAKNGVRDSVSMSAQKRLRQSEILRRRSKLSEVSPAPLRRDSLTPDGGDGHSTEGDASVNIDVSMG